MKVYHILLFFMYLATTDSTVLDDINGKILALIRISINNKVNTFETKRSAMNRTKVLNDANIFPEDTKEIDISNELAVKSKIGTKFPWIEGQSKVRPNYRRQYTYLDETGQTDEETVRESSSSMEMQQWKEDFDVDWINMKMKAIEEQISHNLSEAHQVNIAAARPWSIPCGDPNQYDTPWGSCTMPSQCDGEYRIYRGDIFCDTTSQFVCCALQHTQHDLYQALDMSFVSSSESTSSEEKRKRLRGSREYKHKKKARQRNRIRRTRLRRKRQMKKKIRKLARQIRKELNRAFRNSTDDRRHRTRKLKEMIKAMKKKFIYERKAAREILDNDINNIDDSLRNKLAYVKKLNHDFLMNNTFRNIITGNANKSGKYLQLPIDWNQFLRNGTEEEKPITEASARRFGGGVIRKKKQTKRKDYLEYDIEYGALYF